MSSSYLGREGDMTTNSSAVHYLDRPEGRVAFEVTGAGPLVICLPGMGELRSSYRFTVPALAAAGFRVATMDLRGHGDSDATFTAYDDVAAGRTPSPWPTTSAGRRSWWATRWAPAPRSGPQPNGPRPSPVSP
jgi:alpha-beta hydrolase superfamily lysophospholipase